VHLGPSGDEGNDLFRRQRSAMSVEDADRNALRRPTVQAGFAPGFVQLGDAQGHVETG
jgi:hypothetical protein